MDFPDSIEVTGVDVCRDFDDFAFAIICLAAAAMGWKKAAPALLLFIAIDVWQNSGKSYSDVAEKIARLLTVLAVVSVVRWVWSRFKQRKPTASNS